MKIILVGLMALMLTGCTSSFVTGTVKAAGLEKKVTKICYAAKSDIKCPEDMLGLTIMKQRVCMGFTDALDYNPNFVCYVADVVKD